MAIWGKKILWKSGEFEPFFSWKILFSVFNSCFSFPWKVGFKRKRKTTLHITSMTLHMSTTYPIIELSFEMAKFYAFH